MISSIYQIIKYGFYTLLIFLSCLPILIKCLQIITLKRMKVKEFKHPDYPKTWLSHDFKISGWMLRKATVTNRKVWLDMKNISNICQKKWPNENKIAIWRSPVHCVVLCYGADQVRDLYSGTSGALREKSFIFNLFS